MGFKVKTLLNITRQPKTPEDKSTFLSIQKAPQAENNYPQCPCQRRRSLTPMSVKRSHTHTHTHKHTHTHTHTHTHPYTYFSLNTSILRLSLSFSSSLLC